MKERLNGSPERRSDYNANAYRLLLRLAQQYHALGFTPIPCKPRSKEPACKWEQLQHRRPEWSELQQLWADAIKRFGCELNIATLLGKAHGLCAIDIDNPQLFRQARTTVGLNEEELLTWTTLSYRGGALIFRYPKNFEISKISNPNWGAELLGNGHILVLPPSIHPAGAQYRWLKHPAKTPLADIPPVLLETFGLQASQPDNSNGLPEWATVVIRLLKPYWTKGWRHDLSLALAGVLAKRSVPREVAQEIFHSLVVEFCDEEVKDRLRALLDTYDRYADGDEILAWKGLESIIDSYTIRALDAIIPRQAHNAMNNQIPTVRLLRWSEWREQCAAPRRWLVSDIIKQGDIVVINARPKTGKSIVLTNIARALLLGEPFLGFATTPACVIFADFERPVETDYRLMVLGIRDHERLFTITPLIGIDALGDFKKAVTTLKEQFPDYPVVVLIDTLHDFLRTALRQRKATINDYTAVSEVLQSLRDFAVEFGITFIMTHHQRKTTGDEISEIDLLGSTAVSGKIDVVAHLTVDRVDASVLRLTFEGNSINRTTVCFAIQDTFLTERVEAPPQTKEEQVARAVVSFLQQQGGRAKRKDIIRHLVDVGLCSSESVADNYLKGARALKWLEGRVTRGAYWQLINAEEATLKDHEGGQAVNHIDTDRDDRETVITVNSVNDRFDRFDRDDRDFPLGLRSNGHPDDRTLTVGETPVNAKVSEIYGQNGQTHTPNHDRTEGRDTPEPIEPMNRFSHNFAHNKTHDQSFENIGSIGSSVRDQKISDPPKSDTNLSQSCNEVDTEAWLANEVGFADAPPSTDHRPNTDSHPPSGDKPPPTPQPSANPPPKPLKSHKNLSSPKELRPEELESEERFACPNCGNWRRVPVSTVMLVGPPRCPVCGSTMNPAQEPPPIVGGDKK